MIFLTKRLGIFCTYDSEGIVDGYIIFLLQDIKKILTHLAIICNGKLTPESKKRLEDFTDDLVVRENIGFDMEAWRQGIFQKNLSDYDELILFNDSFYGPFYPFTEIFQEMDTKNSDADFWGITVHGKTKDPDNLCPYGYIPEHVQSYFLVIREKMLHSAEFFEYWKNAEVAQTFDEAVKKHEVCFTKYFFDKGFTYAAYCDTRNCENEYEIKINPYVFFTEKILTEQHCPVIKKRVFYFGRESFLSETYGNIPRDCINFLRTNTNYDVSLIVKNLLRKFNIATIKSDLGLNYIISSTVPANKKVNFKDAVLVANLKYADLIPNCVKYLSNVPKDIHLVVTVSTEEKKSVVEKLFSNIARPCEVRIAAQPATDLSALYLDCADLFKNFKYLGFIHDIEPLDKGYSLLKDREFFHLLWKNFLDSEIFIENTLAILEDDKNLGILTPSPPYHGYYRGVFFADCFWNGRIFFDKTLELAETLNIPQKFLDDKIAPLTIGNVFWCRTAALKNITDYHWRAKDFVENKNPKKATTSLSLERIISFAAQNEGFYTGWLMTENFAQNEIENFICFSTKNPVIISNEVVTSFYELFQHFKVLLKPKMPAPIWSCLKFINRICEKFGFRV